MDIIPGPYGDNRTVADSQIETLGHPGKYYGAINVRYGNQVDCTGSDFGIGAIIKSGSYNGDIYLTGGGFIHGENLTSGQIYELSVLKVTGGNVGGIYLLKTGL
jgi:hypothetical protein